MIEPCRKRAGLALGLTIVAVPLVVSPATLAQTPADGPTTQPASQPAPSLTLGDIEALLNAPTPSRPVLTGELKETVEALEKQIDELRNQGKYEEAIPLAEDVLALRQKHQTGWTDLDGNPAEWWEVADARWVLRDLQFCVAMSEQNSAALLAINAIDSELEALYAAGRYEDAQRLAERQLEGRGRLLGEEHQSTIASLNNVGGMLWQQSKLDDAESVLRPALDLSRRVLGDEHPHTLQSLNNLARLLQSQGKLYEAELLYVDALIGKRRVLGPKDPSTLTSINSLGALFLELGKFSGAEPCLREALHGRRRVLGEDHPDTLTSISNLGSLLLEQRRVGEAIPYFEVVVDAQRRVLGDQHPKTFESIHNLGSAFEAQGRFAEAEQCYLEALSGKRRTLRARHPSTLRSMNNLAVLLKTQGRRAEAESYHREFVEAYQDEFGFQHSETLTALSNLAGLLYESGDLEEAARLWRKALEGYQNTLGAGSTKALILMSQLGVVLTELGEYGSAELHHRDAVDGLRRALGLDHPFTLKAIQNMGVFLRKSGRLSDAEPLYEEALTGFRRALGDEHPGTLTAISNMGALLEAQGKRSEAEQYYREALALAERLRVAVAGDAQSRAAYAGALRLAGVGGALSSLLVETDRASEAWSIMERYRSRALLDLLAREDRDLLAMARKSADPEQAAALARAVADEDAAEVALTTVEARLEGIRKERDAAEKRTDWSQEEKAARLAGIDRQIAQQQELIKRSRRELGEAVASVNMALRGLYPDAQPLTIEEIRSTLAPGEMLVCFVWMKDRVAVLTAKGASVGDDGVGGVVVTKAEDDVASLADLARTIRSSLADRPSVAGDRVDSSAAKKLLAALLPDSICDDLSRARRVVILSDGPLNGIPFEALVEAAGEDESPFRSDATITYASSGTIYVNRKKAAESKPESLPAYATLVGSPVYDRSAPPAPNYPDEGVLITQVADASNAANAGLRRGDVLLSYGDAKLPEASALGPAIAAVNAAVETGKLGADYSVIVTYWRDGEVKETTLAPGKLGVQPDRGSPKDGLEYMQMASRGLEEKVGEISMLDQVRLHGGRLVPLPGTKREAEAIANVIRMAGGAADLLLGEDATIARLEAAVEGKRILHIATHGLTGSSDRPYDASLALTRPETPSVDDIGFLTMDRLIGHWRGKLKDCDLVVLSACDTQHGAKVGDSIMALPWGFFYAGAPTVIASLWKVDDTATQLLMTRFHQNLLGVTADGRRTELMSKAEALKEAKQWLRNLPAAEVRRLLKITDDSEWGAFVSSHRGIGGDPARTVEAEASTLASTLNDERLFDHPYYWAAFILIGSPD